MARTPVASGFAYCAYGATGASMVEAISEEPRSIFTKQA
jgi:hypothetical protein